MKFDIVREIRDLNPARAHVDLPRRLLKVIEELGECAEAFLHVTTAANPKKKTWDDCREEAADVVIILIDAALTSFPGSNYPHESLIPQIISEVFDKTPDSDTSKILNTIFDVSKAVGHAYDAARKMADGGDPEEFDMQYCGAIARALRHAIHLGLFKFHEENDEEVRGDFVNHARRKIDKWKLQQGRGQDIVSGILA